ncbi:unnamed protein product [Caenorhabditis brenneri]
MDQEKYEVEAILDEKGRGSNKQFLVKWKNYPEEDNSWETEKNLQGCKKLLSAFKKNRDTANARAARERPRVSEARLQHRAGRADARRAEARVQEQARQADALVQERAHQAGGQVQEEGARAEGQGQEGAHQSEAEAQELVRRNARIQEGQRQWDDAHRAINLRQAVAAAQEEAHQAVGQEQEATRNLLARFVTYYRDAAAADAVRRDEAEASRLQNETDARLIENLMINRGMQAPRAEDEAAHPIEVQLLLNGEVHSPVRRVIGHEKKADGTLAFAVKLENGDEVGILQEHIFQLCGQMAINYLASEVVTGML